MKKICYFCNNIRKRPSNSEPYCYKAEEVQHGGGYGSHFSPRCIHDTMLEDYFEPVVEGRDTMVKSMIDEQNSDRQVIEKQRQEIQELKYKIDKLLKM